MATRETRLQRGRTRGQSLSRQLVRELREARVIAGVSQRAIAQQLGCSQSEVSRFEKPRRMDVSVGRLSEVASLLGLELSAGLHPVGDSLRDKGHQALVTRFRNELSPAWRVTAEVPLPLSGDLRTWDLLLRLQHQLLGVEAETRVRDIQSLVRRIRRRERDGGVDGIVLVLARSSSNRRVVAELREALGPEFATSPRAILGPLRAGHLLPGSGVILL